MAAQGPARRPTGRRGGQDHAQPIAQHGVEGGRTRAPPFPFHRRIAGRRRVPSLSVLFVPVDARCADPQHRSAPRHQRPLPVQHGAPHRRHTRAVPQHAHWRPGRVCMHTWVEGGGVTCAPEVGHGETSHDADERAGHRVLDVVRTAACVGCRPCAKTFNPAQGKTAQALPRARSRNTSDTHTYTRPLAPPHPTLLSTARHAHADAASALARRALPPRRSGSVRLTAARSTRPPARLALAHNKSNTPSTATFLKGTAGGPKVTISKGIVPR